MRTQSPIPPGWDLEELVEIFQLKSVTAKVTFPFEFPNLARAALRHGNESIAVLYLLMWADPGLDEKMRSALEGYWKELRATYLSQEGESKLPPPLGA